MENKLICKICNKSNETYFQLSYHINSIHIKKEKIFKSLSEYYDKFIRADGEGICPVTKEQTNFINLENGYRKYKNASVCRFDPNYKEKIIKGLKKAFDKYDKHPNKKEKTLQDLKNEEKNKEIKNILGLDVDYKNLSTKEKRRLSCLIKYGVEHPSQNKQVKNKVKETVYKNFGGFSFESKVILDKIKKTNLEKYGDEFHTRNNEVKNKIKKANLEKTGYDNPLKNPEIRNKIKKTLIEKYGTNSGFEIVAKKFGKNHICEIVEIKQKIDKNRKESVLRKYNVDNIAKVPEVKRKIEQTNLERYGVKDYLVYYNDNFNFNIKKKIYKFKNSDELGYYSNTELEFLKFCDFRDIKVEKPNFYIKERKTHSSRSVGGM